MLEFSALVRVFVAWKSSTAKFLKRFWKILTGSSKQPDSERLLVLSVDSTLARFIVDRKKYSKGKVEASAFLPPEDLKLSTFCVDSLTEERIWNLGEREFAIPINRTLRARGDVKVGDIPAPLKSNLDNDPPRHVDIEGWPKEIDARLELALALALKAKLHLNPSPVKGR